jgi:hypothetical protein
MGLNSSSEPDAPIGRGEFTARVLWIALRLVFVVWLAERGQSFVYQAF